MVIFACIYVLRTNTIDTVHLVRYGLARTPVVIIIIFSVRSSWHKHYVCREMYVRARTRIHRLRSTNTLRPQLVNQNDARCSLYNEHRYDMMRHTNAQHGHWDWLSIGLSIPAK